MEVNDWIVVKVLIFFPLHLQNAKNSQGVNEKKEDEEQLYSSFETKWNINHEIILMKIACKYLCQESQKEEEMKRIDVFSHQMKELNRDSLRLQIITLHLSLDHQKIKIPIY